MRVETRHTIAGETTGVALTKAEHETLRRAAAIADRARSLALALDPDEGGPLGDDLAHVSIAVDEIDASPWPGFVPVLFEARPRTRAFS